MNAPKRLRIRLPLNTPANFDITDIVPVFHHWIQAKTVPGLLIDVADYKHVPNGPGIFLIGDEGDYSLEQVDGRFNLVYDRKRQTGGDLSESIRILFETAQVAGEALKAESDLGVSVADEAAELTLLDRLQYPNSLEVFDEIRHSIAEGIATVYGNSNVKLSYSASDARRPLTIHIETEQELALA